MGIFGKIFGTKNERELARMAKVLAKVNAIEPHFAAMDDATLQLQSSELKQQLQGGKTLDEILPQAFAVCREASKRVLGMRHFDVQIIGGLTLHEGRIAEMRTGEGKTLMATLACYLNALAGKNVHVVTVNDYLAQRDAELNRPLFEFLGMQVGVVHSQQLPESKHAAYQADITYGTNNEFGFDFLRDHMVYEWTDKKQRGLHFAIIDEVDSILIDEARTPLIISGQSHDSSQLYTAINTIAPMLALQPAEKDTSSGHFWLDEKFRTIELNERGYEFVEAELIKMQLLAEGESLYSPSNLALVHHIHSAIKAHNLFDKDVHYIVQQGQIVIVDEHTGRTMPGRRWSEGLHQAVEAKEGVSIQPENQTLANTTFQNYFRLYGKLSGMTGTADTEAAEFRQIYGLDVVVIPTHNPMVRQDLNDEIYLTRDGKYRAVIAEIKALQESQAPILVGTATIEASEYLSNMLTEAGISHEVLNAKQHAREADIVAQAGRLGAVTIATNMAGRGTDIILGGNWKVALQAMDNATEADAETLKAQWVADNAAVIAAGGLHIIGSERHDSRRIDNQLRGRSGRQGDPGKSKFFLSLEDDLMRRFAGDRVVAMMRGLGMNDDEAIAHRMVSRSIENAQHKVEAHNFDMRKNLLKYDDVANEQRKIVYAQRDEVLSQPSIQEGIEFMLEEVVLTQFERFVPVGSIEDQWNISGLSAALQEQLGVDLPLATWLQTDKTLNEDSFKAKITQACTEHYRARRAQMGEDNAVPFERAIMLQNIDHEWKEHLSAMDHLRSGIHLRGYAQKNPEQEYKKEAFNMFSQMLDRIKAQVVKHIATVHIPSAEEVAALQQAQLAQAHALEEQLTRADDNPGTPGNPYAHMDLNRNSPCPCDSGKKYKHCHGALS